MTPQYLRSLYPSAQPGQYVVLGYTDPLGKAVIHEDFFDVSDPDWPTRLLERTKVLGSEQRSTFVYRGLASCHSRKDQDVVACHYVAVDYDTKDGYPRDLSTLWAALEELKLPRPVPAADIPEGLHGDLAAHHSGAPGRQPQRQPDQGAQGHESLARLQAGLDRQYGPCGPAARLDQLQDRVRP